MIVKVCGITDKEQYNELAGIDVDMLGFNFYPKSKRFLNQPLDPNNQSELDKNVGVFVNPSETEVYNSFVEYNLSYIQLHGNETPEFCAELSSSTRLIKAFGVDDSFDFETTMSYESLVEYFLFDTKTPQYGGSGKKFNWEKLNEYKGNTPFLLSGGISLEDVDEILSIQHSYFAGIDINSGFELSPGIKNIKEIKELLKIIR